MKYKLFDLSVMFLATQCMAESMTHIDTADVSIPHLNGSSHQYSEGTRDMKIWNQVGHAEHVITVAQYVGRSQTADSHMIEESLRHDDSQDEERRVVLENCRKKLIKAVGQSNNNKTQSLLEGHYAAKKFGRTESAVNRLLKVDIDTYGHLPEVFISEYRIRVTREADRYLELMVKNGINLHNYRVVIQLAALKNYFYLSQFSHSDFINGYKIFALSGLSLGHHPNSTSRISLEKLTAGVWTSVQADLQDKLDNAEIDKTGSNRFFDCSLQSLGFMTVEKSYDPISFLDLSNVAMLFLSEEKID
ncbi:hypothetical protein [Marinicella sp. W31]|uniref:hypothetical protein n=1 Tax=Marinicella sp. W31 TaxID=3023713 RepID=UPI0037572EA7